VAERVGVSPPKQTKDLAWLTPEKSPIDTHRALPRVANPEAAKPENASDFDTTKTAVRERPILLELGGEYQECVKRPAHPSNRLVAQLNPSWRVVDDPLQWILQRRKGNQRTKNSGWRDRSFCRMKDALLSCIRAYCGEIDADGLSKLSSLPDWHPDWDRGSQRTNLDVRETDQAHADEQSESLVSQTLGACED
jgi:hypothetical protein